MSSCNGSRILRACSRGALAGVEEQSFLYESFSSFSTFQRVNFDSFNYFLLGCFRRPSLSENCASSFRRNRNRVVLRLLGSFAFRERRGNSSSDGISRGNEFETLFAVL